jgi:uncharacterized protein (TIGR03435 family)
MRFGFSREHVPQKCLATEGLARQLATFFLDVTWPMQRAWREPLISPEKIPHRRTDFDQSAILTAVSDQLVLKLVAKKGPVQVFVIEKIEKPAEK